MGRDEQARAARHRQPIGRQLPYQVVSRGRLGWVSAVQLVFIDTVSVRRCPSWSAGSGTGVARAQDHWRAYLLLALTCPDRLRDLFTTAVPRPATARVTHTMITA